MNKLVDTLLNGQPGTVVIYCIGIAVVISIIKSILSDK